MIETHAPFQVNKIHQINMTRTYNISQNNIFKLVNKCSALIMNETMPLINVYAVVSAG